MKHLLDVDLAVKYGIHAAIIFENLCYWIKENETNDRNFYDGSYWTFNSKKAYTEIFPYMTEKQIRTAFQVLIDDDLVKTGVFNEMPYDRTLWYTLTEKGKSICHTGQIHLPHRANGSDPQGKSNCPTGQTNTNNKPFINTLENTLINNKDMEKAVLAWNALGISKVTKIPQNSDRYKQLKKRIEEYGIDEVLRAIQVVGNNDFLNGTNDKGWNATFDWLVKPNNFLKVIEGNYDRSNKVKMNQQAQELDDFYRMTDEWVRSHENDV